MDGMKDGAEMWTSHFSDGGRTWSEFQILFASVKPADPSKPGWYNYCVSYLEAVIDKRAIHVFFPLLWRRTLHSTISESDLDRLPTVQQLSHSVPSP